MCSALRRVLAAKFGFIRFMLRVPAARRQSL
jgi:hypothetical protein